MLICQKSEDGKHVSFDEIQNTKSKQLQPSQVFGTPPQKSHLKVGAGKNIALGGPGVQLERLGGAEPIRRINTCDSLTASLHTTF